MSEEEDIKEFANKGDFLATLNQTIENEGLFSVRHITERTNIYIEFLAAAFLKETGLKASEAELVVSYGIDKVHFSFRRKENG